MKNARTWLATTIMTAVVAVAMALGFQSTAAAHCDTLDGPVVQDARTALAAKDVPGLTELTRGFPEASRKGLLALPRLYGDVAVLYDARQVLPARLVPPVPLVLLVLSVRKVRRVPRGSRDRSVRRDRKDPPASCRPAR